MQIKKNLAWIGNLNPHNFFVLVCCILAAYFFSISLWPLFPPGESQRMEDINFSRYLLFFSCCRFRKEKIEIFEFFSYEAKIKEVKASLEMLSPRSSTCKRFRQPSPTP